MPDERVDPLVNPEGSDERHREDLGSSIPTSTDDGATPRTRIDDVYDLVYAASVVIRRWDADEVDAGAMDRDIERLRSAMSKTGGHLTIRSD